MKVRELIALLVEVDQELEVIFHTGEEWGRTVDGADSGFIYEQDGHSYGEIYPENWSADDAAMDSDEWDNLRQTCPRCVLLYNLGNP